MQKIATFYSSKQSPLEAARQGSDDSSESLGEIRFEANQQYEAALDGIEGFDYIWLIFGFHKNDSWKPKVLPPRGSDKKIGVFATRSPYRPNQIGLSAVKLVKREGLSLFVSQFDLLDQSPIYDIKPYLPYADSFSDAKMGWLEGVENSRFEVKFSTQADSQIQYLQRTLTEFRSTLIDQLSFEPLNHKKKRVREASEGKYTFSYKTWRADFWIQGKEVQIEAIYSGYSEDEMRDPMDPYQDKETHKKFKDNFK